MSIRVMEEELAYNIIVPSSQPLKDIMRNREATRRIGKWAAELNE